MLNVKTRSDYDRLYQQSMDDPDGFWRDQARILDWVRFPTRINQSRFVPDVSIRWFDDGILNACYNCVDRHLPMRAGQVALIAEGDAPGDVRRFTFRDMHDQVARLGNALKGPLGIAKGDRVIIYMPMIAQAVMAMLACARIGAIHSVVFGGFSDQSLRDRIVDCGATLVITADEGLRGGKTIPLKANVDQALAGLPAGMPTPRVLVYPRTSGPVEWDDARDHAWAAIVDTQSPDCPCEPMGAEDPLFILYTSGSTGKPKGVLHTTGGYLVYAALTHRVSFDIRADDVYWCTADVGWVTGHSYIVYGPLANGTTTLIFEGVPGYPDYARLWHIVDAHRVSVFYTAPTAIRTLLREGDRFLETTSRASLRILGTVGEPINTEAWHWYHDKIGKGRCPIIDTWWQTETGGHLITPLPGLYPLKPGSAMKPFFGVQPVLRTPEGVSIDGAGEGHLCIASSWPGQMRTVYGDHARFVDTYFKTHPGHYFTGDGARRDEDGDYWITGRVDDVINVSGHRLGTAEIESAINEHPAVAESAVVGYPHPIKGQGICAFVILLEGLADDGTITGGITQCVRRIIGPIAAPDRILIVPGLPKTRSGKIMRRILRKLAEGDIDTIGDTSTLADPGIVEQILATIGQSKI